MCLNINWLVPQSVKRSFVSNVGNLSLVFLVTEDWYILRAVIEPWSGNHCYIQMLLIDAMSNKFKLTILHGIIKKKNYLQDWYFSCQAENEFQRKINSTWKISCASRKCSIFLICPQGGILWIFLKENNSLHKVIIIILHWWYQWNQLFFCVVSIGVCVCIICVFLCFSILNSIQLWSNWCERFDMDI